ncbi:hypothetical protein HPP92_012437 [Vanilla planifolia]|uniref:Exocyst complex component EXO84C n=1 Tax=Vanilla planifolia TaxID=51239 RepID=A0A835QZG4_VANPL|nr:hypothetical protein HPP92_012437 [Vanilla planifolia]
MNVRDENTENGFQNSEIDDILNGKIDEPKATFLETLDMLLAEHKVEEILLILDSEEKNNPELKNLGESPSNEASPYMEAFQIRRNAKKIFLTERSPTAVAASSSILFTSRRRFMLIVESFGTGSKWFQWMNASPNNGIKRNFGQSNAKIHFLLWRKHFKQVSPTFDKYVDILIKALPGTSDDDSLIEHKEPIAFRAETDAEQLVLLGNAFTISDEFLPGAVTRVLSPQTAKRDDGGGPSGSIALVAISAVEYKDWRRHLQHSFEKLRDYFCRQYVLTFIYSREGKARMDARMYLDGKADDLFWDSDPLPSLPFQALFARLQQLASVAGDVLLGKEKLQKNLLSRLTETVVMWLSEEQEFWDVFEDEAIQIHPFGLQQLILDMHFVAEIAVCGGYSSRNIHQLVSVIITRAIGTFSERGIDPQSALPEDEWFADTAKVAINKLLLGTSASESSEAEPHEHMILHGEVSDAEKTPSSPSSTTESSETFLLQTWAKQIVQSFLIPKLRL